MPKTRANGIDLYYELHGEGEPLVLIMGLRRNAAWWYRQIPSLSRHFKILAFDNRGAGRSDKPRMGYSIRLFADDTAALMDALRIPTAHVLGVSMGGYIAQELAIRYPDKVRKLILGCTGCGGPRAIQMSPERRRKFISNRGLSPEETLRKDMDIYFSDPFVRDSPEKIEEFIGVSLLHYQPLDAFFRQFAACRGHDTLDRISAVTAPTLIMTGDDDPLVPWENSLVLQKRLPRAELQTFPHCRHAFFIEEAERFNERCISFLQRPHRGPNGQG